MIISLTIIFYLTGGINFSRQTNLFTAQQFTFRILTAQNLPR